MRQDEKYQIIRQNVRLRTTKDFSQNIRHQIMKHSDPNHETYLETLWGTQYGYQIQLTSDQGGRAQIVIVSRNLRFSWETNAPRDLAKTFCNLMKFQFVAICIRCNSTRKVDWKVAIVMEQFLRMLHACGLPKTDATWLQIPWRSTSCGRWVQGWSHRCFHCWGRLHLLWWTSLQRDTFASFWRMSWYWQIIIYIYIHVQRVNSVFHGWWNFVHHDCRVYTPYLLACSSISMHLSCSCRGGDAKMTLFTGSQRVADKLAVDLKGKVWWKRLKWHQQMWYATLLGA